MTVVSDASPLIALYTIDRLNLIEVIYGTVTVPPAVSREVFDVIPRKRPAWVRVQALAGPIPEMVAQANLGPGETEAITLALETHAQVLLLDERPARSLARALGLQVVGVGGLLIAAKELHRIATVREPLERLVRSGFHFTPELFTAILQRAGEDAV